MDTVFIKQYTDSLDEKRHQRRNLHPKSLNYQTFDVIKSSTHIYHCKESNPFNSVTMEDWTPPIGASGRTLGQFLDLITSDTPRPAPQAALQQEIDSLKGFRGVSKYRRIIPIGRPPERRPLGAVIICNMCQHTTIFRPEIRRRKDGTVARLYVFCSNRRCQQELLQCHFDYLSELEKDISNLKPRPPPNEITVPNFDHISLCNNCCTAIPHEYSNNLIHPYWEDSQGDCGAYHKKLKEGRTVMHCCQCYHQCGLRKQQPGQEMSKEGKYGYELFCS